VGTGSSGSATFSTGSFKFGSSLDLTGSNYVSALSLSPPHLVECPLISHTALASVVCGAADVNGLNLFPGSASSAFSVAAWVKLASLGSSYSSRNIVRKDSFLVFQFNTLTGNTGKEYGVRHPVCVRACARACVRACVRACIRVRA
jgi:hypothetical protein